MFTPMRTLDIGPVETKSYDPHDNTTRLDMCKQVREYTDGQGKLGYKKFYCGNYRTCETCATFRANNTRDRVWSGSCRTPYVPCDTTYYKLDGAQTSSIEKFAEKLGAKNYLRLPQPDGNFIFFVNTESTVKPDASALLETKVLSADQIKALDFKALTQTPYKQRITGDYGKGTPIEIKDKDMLLIQVTTKVVVSNAPIEARLQAFEAAVNATKDIVPEFVENIEQQVALLEDAMDARTEAYNAELIKLGYETIISERKLYTEINRNYTKRTWLRTIPAIKTELVARYKAWSSDIHDLFEYVNAETE